MTWFGTACELHRDWRNDIEGLGALFSNHIPDYRNLINSFNTLTASRIFLPLNVPAFSARLPTGQILLN